MTETKTIAGTTVRADDEAAVRAWFKELEMHVQAVDFAAARHLFRDDFIAFGTFSDFVELQPEIEQKQWRNVWPTIDDFVWREDIRALVSPDRLFAVGLGVFDSTGYHPDGSTFPRAGRATVSLGRSATDEPFVANHTHMSLFRGTPDVSHGNKPSRS
jgi:ketosteroid isomerase-like protein